MTYMQVRMASSRKSETALEQRIPSISRLILTPWTLLVSQSYGQHTFRLITHILQKTVAPATGTPETGGWSTRELRTIIRGLDGLNFIGADIVEVAPAYDTNAELSTM